MFQRPRTLLYAIRHLPPSPLPTTTMRIVPNRQITSKNGISPSLIHPPHRQSANNRARAIFYSCCNVLHPTKLTIQHRAPTSSTLNLATSKNISSTFARKRFTLRSNVMRLFSIPNRRQDNMTVLYNRRGTTNILISPIRQTRSQTLTPHLRPNHVTINRHVRQVIRHKVRDRIQQLIRRSNRHVLVSNLRQSLQLQNRANPIDERFRPGILPNFSPTIHRSKLFADPRTTTIRLSHTNRLNKSNAPTRGVTRRHTIHFKQRQGSRFRPYTASPGALHRV